jgi:hypothetical protein
MTPLEAAGAVAGWSADWAWSLPLIVTTVVIHVLGLGLMHERVVLAVSRIVEQRRFTLLFALGMGITVLLVTALHALEAFVWAGAYWLLGALPDIRSSTLFSFGAMTTYGGTDLILETHWRLMGALEALNGIILFGLTTAFLFSAIHRVWTADAERRGRY